MKSTNAVDTSSQAVSPELMGLESAAQSVVDVNNKSNGNNRCPQRVRENMVSV
ncbi:MAG: hypothetical protein ACOYMN_01810 [Roseimicrobium sp.]